MREVEDGRARTRWLAYWVFALGTHLAVGTNQCSDSFPCIAACLQAHGGEACVSVTCNPTHRRCDCGSQQLLKLDGTCEDTVIYPVSCDPRLSVTFNIAAGPSPELSSQDIAVGNVSAPMVAWLQRVVGVALGHLPQEVAITDPRLSKAVASVFGMSGNGLLHFELRFDFCSTRELAEFTWIDFERRFRVQAQKYAAFQLSTLSIIAYSTLGASTTASVGANAAALGDTGTGELAPGDEVRGDAGAGMIAFMIFTLVVLAMAAALTVVMVLMSRRRSKVLAGDTGGTLAGDHACTAALELGAERLLATVACAFTPGDIEHGGAFTEAWLGLAAGDVVEVVAGSSGWLYGRLVGRPDRIGFFPENCISWMGPLISSDAAQERELPALGVVALGPSSTEEVGHHAEGLLEVEVGEVVEVVSAHGCWLNCRAFGEPERTGYVSVGRIIHLVRHSDQAEAIRTSSGLLVQVEHSFVVDDTGEREAVDFSKSCISLEHGDVVEVAAGSGGWLYGRAINDPGRAGYFPETCISWLGKPLPVEVTGIESAELPAAEGPSSGVDTAPSAAVAESVGGPCLPESQPPLAEGSVPAALA